MEEFRQVLPALSRSQIQVLLRGTPQGGRDPQRRGHEGRPLVPRRRSRGIATVKRDLLGTTGQSASLACKWLIDKPVGAEELQRGRRWLQSGSKTLQTTCRATVFQPFTWISEPPR
jgi:hypothetical protein